MRAVLESAAGRTPGEQGQPRGWRLSETLGDPAAVACPAALRAQARTTLHDDVTSEFDARFFDEYVRARLPRMSTEFAAILTEWSRDEAHHYSAFRTIYEAAFPNETGAFEGLRGRQPDFTLLEHLFDDEFQVLVLLAYDELGTVRAFQENFPLYDAMGAGVGRVVRRVVADEARHYASFLQVLRSRHSHRFGEAAEAVQRVRAAEEHPYRSTFVLDHDGDAVWSDAICDRAARVLTEQLDSRCGRESALGFVGASRLRRGPAADRARR